LGTDHERDHGLLDHLVLRDDDFAQFFQNLPVSDAEFFDQGRIIHYGLLRVFHLAFSLSSASMRT
jgi:hypothetical protein